MGMMILKYFVIHQQKKGLSFFFFLYKKAKLLEEPVFHGTPVGPTRLWTFSLSQAQPILSPTQP